VIAAAGTTLGVSWISSYLYTTYKTHSEFGRLSINNTIVALAGLGLMSLVWKYGFLGMLLRAPAVALFSLAALHFRRPMPVAPRWDGSRLLILTKTGVPIFLLGQASIVFFSTDRLSLVGDTRALGYYTLAIQASTAAQMIPSAFSTVVYPRLAHILGRADRAIPLWSHTRAAAVGVTLLGGVIGVLGWVVTPWVVAAFLPHYKPGVAAAQWSCLLGLAMGPCIFANIFNVIRRQDLYAVCWALGMGGFGGGRWVLGRMGGERTVVAAQSLLLGAVVLSAACVVLSLWACRVHDRVHAIRAAAAA
jgi:O-antigen/teichoic acid export membrane protein